MGKVRGRQGKSCGGVLPLGCQRQNGQILPQKAQGLEIPAPKLFELQSRNTWDLQVASSMAAYFKLFRIILGNCERNHFANQHPTGQPSAPRKGASGYDLVKKQVWLTGLECAHPQ